MQIDKDQYEAIVQAHKLALEAFNMLEFLGVQMLTLDEHQQSARPIVVANKLAPMADKIKEIEASLAAVLSELPVD